MQKVRKNIGSRVRETRKRLKMTQKTLGEILGVGISAVSAYESGDSVIPPESLLKISELGNVSLDWLIKGADLPTQPSPYVNEPITDYGPQMAAIRRIVKIIEGHPGCESEVQNLLIDHFYAEKKEERKQEE